MYVCERFSYPELIIHFSFFFVYTNFSGSDTSDDEEKAAVARSMANSLAGMNVSLTMTDGAGNRNSANSPPALNPLFPFLKAAATAAATSALAANASGSTPTFPFSFMNMSGLSGGGASAAGGSGFNDNGGLGEDDGEEPKEEQDLGDIKGMLPYSPLVDCNTCPKCGKTFAHKLNIYRHVKSCGLPPQNSCELCGKKFTQRYKKKIHKMMEHGIPYRPYERV